MSERSSTTTTTTTLARRTAEVVVIPSSRSTASLFSQASSRRDSLASIQDNNNNSKNTSSPSPQPDSELKNRSPSPTKLLLNGSSSSSPDLMVVPSSSSSPSKKVPVSIPEEHADIFSVDPTLLLMNIDRKLHLGAPRSEPTHFSPEKMCEYDWSEYASKFAAARGREYKRFTRALHNNEEINFYVNEKEEEETRLKRERIMETRAAQAAKKEERQKTAGRKLKMKALTTGIDSIRLNAEREKSKQKKHHVVSIKHDEELSRQIVEEHKIVKMEEAKMFIFKHEKLMLDLNASRAEESRRLSDDHSATITSEKLRMQEAKTLQDAARELVRVDSKLRSQKLLHEIAEAREKEFLDSTQKTQTVRLEKEKSRLFVKHHLEEKAKNSQHTAQRYEHATKKLLSKKQRAELEKVYNKAQYIRDTTLVAPPSYSMHNTKRNRHGFPVHLPAVRRVSTLLPCSVYDSPGVNAPVRNHRLNIFLCAERFWKFYPRDEYHLALMKSLHSKWHEIDTFCEHEASLGDEVYSHEHCSACLSRFEAYVEDYHRITLEKAEIDRRPSLHLPIINSPHRGNGNGSLVMQGRAVQEDLSDAIST